MIRASIILQKHDGLPGHLAQKTRFALLPGNDGRIFVKSIQSLRNQNDGSQGR
jgi:hypothetical protein